MNWQAHIRRDGDARLYRLFLGDEPMTFRALFRALIHDNDFTDWYTGVLAGCGLETFFWEHPPLTVNNLDDEAEFALLPAPALARQSANPAPFVGEFARQPDREAITFQNLGSDALLIAPCPIAPPEAYPHLGAFVRNAPPSQVRELWRATSQAVMETLGESPRWLSTSGLGVIWLHLRLDTWPKYYQHAPYRNM